MAGSAPRLSYVVVSDTWATIAELVERLAAQTVAAEIELVVVTPAEAELGSPPPAAACLGGLTVVVQPPTPLAAARAAGVRVASGDVVALGETHVLPEPDWAERLLAAHDGGADAVIPAIENANPGSRLSWASFLMDYGRYSPFATRLPPVPTHNATIRRELLLGAADVQRVLTRGSGLDDLLRDAGARAERRPDVRLGHLNVEKPRSFLAERVLVGRIIAAERRRIWPRARTLAYAAAAPLIAVVLLWRSLQIGRRAPAPGGTALALGAGSLLWAFGETVGYLAGLAPTTEPRMLSYELHKRRHLAA